MSKLTQLDNTHTFHCADGRQILIRASETHPYVAHETVKTILRSDEEPFIRTRTGGLRTTKVGEMMKRLPMCALIWRPDRQFEPFLELFLDVYKSHPIRSCAGMAPFEICPITGKHVHQESLDFVLTIRRTATDTKVYKRQADWESKYVKASESFMRLEAACFEARARCMVVFCSFYLRKQMLTSEEIDAHLIEQSKLALTNALTFEEGGDLQADMMSDGLVSFDELQHYRMAFFGKKKTAPELFEHMIGYAWCIEYAPYTGYHLHAVFFFDGAEEQKHAHKGQLLGERWKMVTNGLGWAHNSNLSWKENHVRCGIGNIEHYQTAKRNNLRQLLRYLAKTEQMVPMLPKAMTNIFGKMQPPQRDPKKGGAPRLKVAQLVSITTTSQGAKW
ncbi:MAG: inovirus-type Gp2 protein [Polaromonas sp.]|uniref:inovirus-type Gp2 protein n=1 Tax=Polaromonas sp. TaxID=1869339 RepID=UPI00248878DB|nr:inovirus-type Gp2 protein [Polaromonas sp.]MDI1237254.1 inovirus-type Gp2 protein [Polaromonas sp.]MDO8387303.1 inovirus-type Gp2 protein [Polaromonas sp.]MDO8776807.1 inovirus-type Gp2 protein [Burkholderiaceae bacterium]